MSQEGEGREGNKGGREEEMEGEREKGGRRGKEVEGGIPLQNLASDR